MTCFSRSISPLNTSRSAMSFTTADQPLFLPLKDSSSCSKFFDELLNDHKFGIESYPPNSAGRRESGISSDSGSMLRAEPDQLPREGSDSTIYLLPKTRSIMAVSEKFSALTTFPSRKLYRSAL